MISWDVTSYFVEITFNRDSSILWERKKTQDLESKLWIGSAKHDNRVKRMCGEQIYEGAEQRGCAAATAGWRWSWSWRGTQKSKRDPLRHRYVPTFPIHTRSRQWLTNITINRELPRKLLLNFDIPHPRNLFNKTSRNIQFIFLQGVSNAKLYVLLLLSFWKLFLSQY